MKKPLILYDGVIKQLNSSDVLTISLNISDTSDTSNGNIRYHNNKFEFRENGAWKTLSSGNSYNYQLITSSQNVNSGDYIFANSSGGSFNLTLPASPTQWDTIFIKDVLRTFGTYPVTILNNGKNIESSNNSVLLDMPSEYKFTYINETIGWVLS